MDKVTAKEINIDAGGYSFLCIFGKHYNIEFLEIPDWDIYVELGDAKDMAYNSDKIYDAIVCTTNIPMGKADFIADKIAKTIRKKGYE